MPSLPHTGSYRVDVQLHIVAHAELSLPDKALEKEKHY